MKRALIFTTVAMVALLCWVQEPQLGAEEEPEVVTRARMNEARVEQSFENLKNQFTPGFKSSLLLSPGGLAAPEAQDLRPRWQFSQGRLFRTQTSTNLAVEGSGLFVLDTAAGQRYTRDGRFTLQRGVLSNPREQAVLGFPLDSVGAICADLHKIELNLDPETKLYAGKYTGFHFDESGKLYGEFTITDPVTGQRMTENVPLYQVALASFAAPSGLRANGTLLTATEDSGKPVIGVAGQGALGRVAPASLELSNVDSQLEQLEISRARSDDRCRLEGSLIIYGRLRGSSENVLSSHGIILSREDSLLTLEGRDRGHLLHALSRVLDHGGSRAEMKTIRKAMKQLEPRLLFAD